MRDFLDAILAFINSESLTDEEFALLPEDTAQAYSLEVYQYLRTVLQNRESASTQLNKLQAYFVAKGVDVSGTPVKDPMSQILVGASLQ